MSITENIERIGCFTSSEIYKLLSSGKKKGSMGATALSYINEKRRELRLGRSLDVETSSRALTWGKFAEKLVFDRLPFGYELISEETKRHPTIKNWSGSTDYIFKYKKISEQKSYYPDKFSSYTDALLTEDLEFICKFFAQEYWQSVSNSIINEVPNAELISFCPYKSELELIRIDAENFETDEPWKYRFISECKDSELPWIPDGGYYKNLNQFEFKVPENDIDFLTEKVKAAILLL